METANFLEIKDLVRLMVKAVALQIQGKKAAEICETCGITDYGHPERKKSSLQWSKGSPGRLCDDVC